MIPSLLVFVLSGFVLAGIEPTGVNEGDAQVHGSERTSAWELGSSFDAIGDINGDQVADLLILNDYQQDSGTSVWPWRVLAVSGVDGAVLWSMSAPEICSSEEDHRAWPVLLQSRNDVDGDGIEEVLVVVRDSRSALIGPWRGVLLAGASGESLERFDIGNDGPPRVLRGALSLGDEGWIPAAQGLLLQRVRESAGDSRAVEFVHGEGAEWDCLRVLSFGPGGLKPLGEVKAPTGFLFCSQPEWIEGSRDSHALGAVVLMKAEGAEVAHVSVIQFSASDVDGGLSLAIAGQLEVVLATSRFKSLNAVALPDINGDGHADFALATRCVLPPGPANRVLIVDGVTSKVIREYVDHGEGVEDHGCDRDLLGECGFASSLAVSANGDAGLSLAVGSTYTGLWNGSVIRYPIDGKGVVEVYAGSSDQHYLGTALRGGLDFNRDGTPDMVAAEAALGYSKGAFPRLHILSGTNFELIQSLPR